MSKKILLIIIACLTLVLLATIAIFAFTQYYLPYLNAVSAMNSNATLTLQEQADGRILVSWPEGDNVDWYLFEVINPRTGQTLYSCTLSGQTCHLIDPQPNEDRTIRITPVASYTVPFESQARERLGHKIIEVTDNFSTPQIKNIAWTPLPATDQVNVALTLSDHANGRMYAIDEDGNRTLAATLIGGQVVLSFGEGQGFPVPTDGQKLAFGFDAFREGKGYVFHSYLTDVRYLVREDLLDDFLALKITDEGCNVYTLTWNETAGKTYILQGRVAGEEQWVTLATVTDGAARSYTTPRLSPLIKMEYRVYSPDTVPMIESPVTTLQTGGRLLYSTVWPIKDLPVFEAPNGATAIGSVSRATAQCVLGIVDGKFMIRFADTFGFIDSNYCMINLPDYLGDHCLYDITNSYSSLYRAHDYEIPNVTGSLVEGYSHVRIGEDQYLVPLLYPAAKKMEKAALTAEELGYKILIYDSFRPQSATVSLHDLSYSFSQTMVPPAEPDPENPDAPVAPPMTFGQYMTDNYRYTLSNFIAKGRSRHNLGVAMDLTLVAMDPNMTPVLPLPDGTLPPEEPAEPELPEEDPLPPVEGEAGEEGEEEEIIPVIGPNGELIMQTVMHDLTWYSERKQNNLNAQILAYIMEGAGFAGIASEWWHYQDNEAYDALNPPALYEGVSAEGWVTNDGETWRYRDVSGQYLTDCMVAIDGEMYAFDADGIATWQEYPTEEPPIEEHPIEQEGNEYDQAS